MLSTVFYGVFYDIWVVYLNTFCRYNEDTATIQRFGEGGEEMSDEITQQTLLPEVKDPNLWMVKCR